jgi:hypothetical protein
LVLLNLRETFDQGFYRSIIVVLQKLGLVFIVVLQKFSLQHKIIFDQSKLTTNFCDSNEN